MERSSHANVARIASPVCLTRRPRNVAMSSLAMRSGWSRICRHRPSPSSEARRVESTMSVNNTVARSRSGGRSTCVPVTNSSNARSAASRPSRYHQSKFSFSCSPTVPPVASLARVAFVAPLAPRVRPGASVAAEQRSDPGNTVSCGLPTFPDHARPFRPSGWSGGVGESGAPRSDTGHDVRRPSLGRQRPGIGVIDRDAT